MNLTLATILIIVASLLGLLYFVFSNNRNGKVIEVIDDSRDGKRVVKKWILSKHLWGYRAKRQYAYIVQQKTSGGWIDDHYVNRLNNSFLGETSNIPLISPNTMDATKHLNVPRIKKNGYSDVKFVDPSKLSRISDAYTEWLLPSEKGVSVYSNRTITVTVSVGELSAEVARERVIEAINYDFQSLYPNAIQAHDIIPAGIIGVSSRGPVNEPIHISSRQEVEEMFGRLGGLDEAVQSLSDSIDRDILERAMGLNNTEENNVRVDG